MNTSASDFVSSTTSNNIDASIMKAVPRMKNVSMAMTRGKQIISTALPIYTTAQERVLPPKKRKAPVILNNDSIVPTTILLRQVASCWYRPSVVNRASSTSGSTFYLERYREKALYLYPQGPQNFFRHCIEPCADPADLQRRRDEKRATKKAAASAPAAEKTATFKNSTILSSNNKYMASNKLTKNIKPTKHKCAKIDETVASRKVYVSPPSLTTATTISRQTQGSSIPTAAYATSQVVSSLSTSFPKRTSPRNKAASPVTDPLPSAKDKYSAASSSNETNPADMEAEMVTMIPLCSRERLPINAGDVSCTVPRGDVPLQSAPPGPDHSLTPPAVRPVRKTCMPPYTTNVMTTKDPQACCRIDSATCTIAAMTRLPVNVTSRPHPMPCGGLCVYHSGTFD